VYKENFPKTKKEGQLKNITKT